MGKNLLLRHSCPTLQTFVFLRVRKLLRAEFLSRIHLVSRLIRTWQPCLDTLWPCQVSRPACNPSAKLKKLKTWNTHQIILFYYATAHLSHFHWGPPAIPSDSVDWRLKSDRHSLTNHSKKTLNQHSSTQGFRHCLTQKVQKTTQDFSDCFSALSLPHSIFVWHYQNGSWNAHGSSTSGCQRQASQAISAHRRARWQHRRLSVRI